MFEKLKTFWHQHEAWVQASLFLAGFLFDLITLTSVDDPLTLIVQFLYLLILSTLLILELIWPNESDWPAKLRKIAPAREEIFHFVLGALLSAFTIFYFKSASLASSFVFMLALTGLLLLNEFPFFKRQGFTLRLGLLTLCYLSYFLVVCSLLFKTVSGLIFFLSLTLTLGLLGLFARKIKGLSLPKTIWYGPLSVLSVFTLLYLFKLVPPVPLSVQFIGIYHQVERFEGNYLLSHERPWWRFWHRGDQHFIAQEGDSPHIFFRLFAPGGFKEQIHVHWRYRDPEQGWQTTDKIPLTISGGRQEGYRGFTFKRHYQPGRWQIRLETLSGVEIGRIPFVIELADDERTRDFKSELH